MISEEISIYYSTESIQEMIREKEKRDRSLIIDSKDTAISASKLVSGWTDRARVLTQEEFKSFLRGNDKK